MGIHSDFLVHWTGKDFHRLSPCSLRRGAVEDARRRYVERLEDTCREGVFMGNGSERIYGFDGRYVETPTVSRLCLTEIRLSQARNHAHRYGLLGIALRREFVLKRGGNPVFYVQSGDQGTLNQNLLAIQNELNALPKDDMLRRTTEYMLTFMKNMSSNEHKTSYTLDLYEEMEWRMVAASFKGMNQSFFRLDLEKMSQRLLVTAADIPLIVFPDRETMTMALANDSISDFFSRSQPTFTTLADCENF